MRETAEAAQVRLQKLKLLQNHYAQFAVFLKDMMAVLGFAPTWMQYDIGNYLQFGPADLMVQAQRGEAKSTITAIFAVWCLIHDPQHRVLIVSAGGKQANEIATLVQRLILTVPTLECLRPDRNAGDRTSVEAFDVHYSLKGVDKSPSVACIGITGNLPGKRADLIIADDIESPKNSANSTAREALLALSREFSAIATGRPGVPARIVYLGTPQTSESIYNTLPGRGFALRIWPGRFPTPKEMSNYGEHLAPSISNRLEADPTLAFGGGPLGDMGQPTDPALFDEEKLLAKQRKEGLSYFLLQYMLSTKLSDSQRFPLKTENLIVMKVGGRMPLTVTRGFGGASSRTFTSSGKGFVMMSPHEVSPETSEFQGIHMRIDPAGGGANADETAYAVTAFLNGTVYVLSIGGMPGGYENTQMEKLADIAAKWKPNVISIEKNMGHGAFSKVWLPILRKKYAVAAIDEPFETGQKESRMIGILEPVMGRGSLVFSEDCVEEDDRTTEDYDPAKRATYSVFFQLSKLTREKKSLKHDDRLDALAGSVGYWSAQLALDQNKAVAKAENQKWVEWFKNPTGRRTVEDYRGPGRRTSVLDKYFR
jgi:hypothetical protein